MNKYKSMAILQDSPSSGSGLLAIFCDLLPEDQIDFHPWLTEDMFPARLNIGFKSCASFKLIEGDGSEFVTLYEVPSVGYLYDKPYQQLRDNRLPRDASFHKKFIKPNRYTLSWVGPEKSINQHGFAEFININLFDIQDKYNDLFNSFYITRYLPSVANNNELTSVRRYLSLEGAHKNFILEESADKKILSNSVLSFKELFSKNKINSIYKRIIQSI